MENKEKLKNKDEHKIKEKGELIPKMKS